MESASTLVLLRNLGDRVWSLRVGSGSSVHVVAFVLLLLLFRLSFCNRITGRIIFLCVHYSVKGVAHQRSSQLDRSMKS
jgi:hypothetical protein